VVAAGAAGVRAEAGIAQRVAECVRYWVLHRAFKRRVEPLAFVAVSLPFRVPSPGILLHHDLLPHVRERHDVLEHRPRRNVVPQAVERTPEFRDSTGLVAVHLDSQLDGVSRARTQRQLR
jgi:hypothetical protein